MISIAEHKRRHKQLAYAMGSCEMEGCIFTDDDDSTIILLWRV